MKPASHLPKIPRTISVPGTIAGADGCCEGDQILRFECVSCYCDDYLVVCVFKYARLLSLSYGWLMLVISLSYVCVDICIYVYMYICIYVYMYNMMKKTRRYMLCHDCLCIYRYTYEKYTYICIHVYIQDV